MELPEWLLQEIGRMYVENLYLRRELGEARAHEGGESSPTGEPQSEPQLGNKHPRSHS